MYSFGVLAFSFTQETLCGKVDLFVFYRVMDLVFLVPGDRKSVV